MGDDFTHAHYVPATALALLAADPLFTNRFGAAYMQDFAKRHTGTEMFNDITGEFSIWDNSAYASREDFREYGIFTSKREESRAQELGFNVYGHYANRDLGFLQAGCTESYERLPRLHLPDEGSLVPVRARSWDPTPGKPAQR
jgi:hypothetical protein